MNGDADQDLFTRLLAEDQNALADRYADVSSDLGKIDEQIRELTGRRERLEARRAVLATIAKLREVELADHEEDERPAVTAKDVARELIEKHPEIVWDASALLAMLADQGVETTPSNARMILQRLLRESVVRRVGHGRYESVHAAERSLLAPDGDDET